MYHWMEIKSKMINYKKGNLENNRKIHKKMKKLQIILKYLKKIVK